MRKRQTKTFKIKSTEAADHMAKLGLYLKKLRLDLGLSIRRASRLSSISPAHLCKIEHGTVFKTVGIDVLTRLAGTYAIPLSAILEEAGLIKSPSSALPPFPQYLREKYNLSPQAIRDLETTREVVIKKYHLGNSTQTSLF